ncbi:MAG TPA: SpoIIE family protein phosphatase [Solirubrobacteraceae bacterium]|nr:SpoIIE family protein phosphatase [Solirubrobacteraceae bacterium]
MSSEPNAIGDPAQSAGQLVEQLRRALAGSEERLGLILDSLGEAITIRGRDDRLIYANRAALDRIGLETVQQLRNADPRELMGGWETTGEDGEPIVLEDLPSVRVLRGEEPEPLLLRAVDRESGEERWSLLKTTAVRDPGGEVEAAVTIIEDVTESRRAALRMEFLARAADVLASSLDYQQTLRNVAGLAVPQLADWCAVDLFTEEGAREPVAIAHIDPAKIRTAERLRAFEPKVLNPDQGLGLVLRTGESQLYTDIPDELLVAAAIDDEHLGLLREVGMRSVLIVPLSIRERTIGALTMVSAESGRTFDSGDVEFAGQIAARAALAVESARLYSERSAIALTLQSSLLPDAIPEIPGWEVAALYRPAGHESEVGGDFYDLWQAGEEWLMMIGDVTGKGVGAATLTSLVRHTARAASEFDSRPAQILQRVDAALRKRPTASLCTALCLRTSPDATAIAAGGHPLPLLVGEDGIVDVGEHGTMLGALKRTRWPERAISMRPGETLVAFTDGVTDTVGAGGERFGAERLRRTLGDLGDATPSALCDGLAAALEEFQVGAQADDTAIVIMRFTGARAAHERERDLLGVHAGRNV